jgi:hypothetical protein
MAFRNDPVVVGLGTRKQATPTPRSTIQREGRPDGAGSEPSDPVDPTEECRRAYAEFRELATKTERRWQWVAAISGVAGLGLGAAMGVWQGRRHPVPALPESK